jgi:hypothetical protein
MLFGLLAVTAIGCASRRPSWINRVPDGYTRNYFRGAGESASSLAVARAKADSDALYAVISSGRFRAESFFLDSVRTAVRISPVRSHSDSIRIARLVRSIHFPDREIRGYERKEWYEEPTERGWRAWLLVRADKDEGAHDPPGRATIVLSSLLLPGSGQYIKGTPVRGVVFATGIVAGVLGGVILQEQGSAAHRNALIANNSQTQRDYYNRWSDYYHTASLTSFALAGGTYVWSISDAVGGDVHIYADRSMRPTIALSLSKWRP